MAVARGSRRGRRGVADGAEGLLRELVAFRTESQAKEATHFPDEARRCIGFVGDFLSGLGFELEGWDVGPSATFPAHPLLVATRPGSGGGRSLAFNAHVDVVPVGDRSSWSQEPFAGDGRRRTALRARRDRHEGRPRSGDVGDEDGARARARGRAATSSSTSSATRRSSETGRARSSSAHLRAT